MSTAVGVVHEYQIFEFRNGPEGDANSTPRCTAVDDRLVPIPGPRSAAKKSYSITASASCWSCQGTSRPSTFAVFMLIDSSNLVGSCMGATARVLGCVRQ